MIRLKKPLFFYEKTRYEPRGIHITEKGGNYRAIFRVFNELKGLIVRGALNDERYNEIENTYKHLSNLYYLYEKDERGKMVSMDELIFRKYNKKLGHGGTDSQDKEAIMAEAQQMIMSGNVQEGMALLEKYKEDMISGIEYSGSAAAVDSWIECLEEIAASAYPVSININR